MSEESVLKKLAGIRKDKKALAEFNSDENIKREAEASMALSNVAKGNSGCKKCEYLIQLYAKTDHSPESYWLMAELFVLLHDGSDDCSAKYATP